MFRKVAVGASIPGVGGVGLATRDVRIDRTGVNPQTSGRIAVVTSASVSMDPWLGQARLARLARRQCHRRRQQASA